jgi:hypothetical protein
VEDDSDHCAAGHPCPPTPSASVPLDEMLSYVTVPEIETEELVDPALIASFGSPDTRAIKWATEKLKFPMKAVAEYEAMAQANHFGSQFIRAFVPEAAVATTKLVASECSGSVIKTLMETKDSDGVDGRGLMYISGPYLIRTGQWLTEHGISWRIGGSSTHRAQQSNAPKPVLSQEVQNLRAAVYEAREKYEKAQTLLTQHDLLEISVTSAVSTLKSLCQKVHEAQDMAQGKQTLELLNDCLGPESIPVWWENQVAAWSTDSEGKAVHDHRLSTYRLDDFWKAQHGAWEWDPVVLYRGRADGAHHKHWYVGIPCAQGGPAPIGLHLKNLGHVFVVLPREDDWYGPKRLASVEQRRAALARDLQEVGLGPNTIGKMHVLCPEHRKLMRRKSS